MPDDLSFFGWAIRQCVTQPFFSPIDTTNTKYFVQRLLIFFLVFLLVINIQLCIYSNTVIILDTRNEEKDILRFISATKKG